MEIETRPAHCAPLPTLRRHFSIRAGEWHGRISRAESAHRLAARSLRSAPPPRHHPGRLRARRRPQHSHRPLDRGPRGAFDSVDHRRGRRGTHRRRRSRRRACRAADAVERRRQLHQHALADQGRALSVPDAGQHARRLRRGKSVAVSHGPGDPAGAGGHGRHLRAHRSAAGRDLGRERGADHGVQERPGRGRTALAAADRRQAVLWEARCRQPA